MLEEVELFVGGGVFEVFAFVVLAFGGGLPIFADDSIAGFFAEGWVGEDDIEAFARVVGEGVALAHGADAVADAVEVEVHGAEADDFVDDVDAGEGGLAEFFELVAVLRLALHVLVGGEEEAAGAAGGVADGFADLRGDAGDDGFDDWARGEVLASAGFDFGGVALQQAFVDFAFDVDAHVMSCSCE